MVSEGENKLSILIQKVNELENNNKLWLYRDGNECINATGGISDSHPLTNSNYTRVNVGKKSEYLSFTHNAKQQMTSCGSNSKIDLTDYKKLKIELKGNISNRPNQLLVLRFVSDINVYESTVFSADLSNLSSNKSTLEFDISNVKESLYLRIISVTTIESTSPFIDSEIYKIWLEK